LLGCATLQADGPKISFGGYHFKTLTNPEFIGAGASDSLILVFSNESKASFVFNNYSEFATDNTPLPHFLAILYGNEKPNNDHTKNLKEELHKDRVSSKVSKTDDLTIYLVTYKQKEKIVILDNNRANSWVSIECTNVDT